MRHDEAADAHTARQTARQTSTSRQHAMTRTAQDSDNTGVDDSIYADEAALPSFAQMAAAQGPQPAARPQLWSGRGSVQPQLGHSSYQGPSSSGRPLEFHRVPGSVAAHPPVNSLRYALCAKCMLMPLSVAALICWYVTVCATTCELQLHARSCLALRCLFLMSRFSKMCWCKQIHTDVNTLSLILVTVSALVPSVISCHSVNPTMLV